MSGRVLLTGATGFLGMEVLARLLERTDREMLCLVRAADSAAAEQRLDDVFAKLYRDGSPHRARVRALAGDLTAGVDAPDQEIDVVCHCAASITFDLPLEEAREINVEGTRAMLELARAVDARRFVHVSTAYVSGAHSGEFTEEMLGSEFRNTYEQTKCEAERLFADVSGMEVAIARPSIVMGESDTGWTPAFNVLYWPLRAFARGLFDVVPAKPEGRVDVVPVDYVADGIFKLIESDETGTFNLVQRPRGDDRGRALRAGLRALRPAAPAVRRDRRVRRRHGRRARGRLPAVLRHGRRLRRQAHARAARSPGPAACARYFDTLMDYADAARWGKRGVSRDEARARVDVAA